MTELTTLAADRVALANRLRPILFRLHRELRREIHSLGDHRRPGIDSSSRSSAVPESACASSPELERVSAPAMSKAIDKLERADLVTRIRGTDRRRVGIEVSAEGHRALASVKRRRTAWLATRMKELSPAELDALDPRSSRSSRLLEVRQG